MEKLEDQIEKCLTSLCQMAEREDSEVRKRQMRIWKENDKFWHGIQQIFWSEARQEWLSPVDANRLGWDATTGMSQEEYDYVINIYRAHGESVIAALSSQVPVVRFPPDDAENEEDQIASVSYSKVADLIAKHNKAKLLQFQALLCFWNEGLVAAYHYNKSDKKFGTYKIQNFKTTATCPQCGGAQKVNPEELQTRPKEVPLPDEADEAEVPQEHNAEQMELIPPQCPQCGEETQLSHELDGESEYAKNRTVIDVFGPLHVKIPVYARSQAECKYLVLYQEISRGELYDLYPELLETEPSSLSGDDVYERSARTPSSYAGIGTFDTNKDLVTYKRFWIRPSFYNELGRNYVDVIKYLKETYPEGCMVAMAGGDFLSVSASILDDHWSIGKAGLSRFIHADALGQPLMPIQKMTNTLANLTEETIEHGIPATYADEDTLNFEAYSQTVSRPGMLTPVRRTPGESISDSFYTGERATLSKEVSLQNAYLEKMSQFVVGSFPSIYGGDAKSRTASEYSQSRQMALQRLSIAWTNFCYWWSTLMGKAAKLFVSAMVADEKFTTYQNGSYITVWIRRAELVGKVGDVEPEGSDSFPATIGQKQALILKLMELQSPELNEAIFDVANRGILSTILGFPEFHIPGEDQRIKQAVEIQAILRGEQVMPIMEIDDHQTHFAECKNFLVSLTGQDLQRTQPELFQKVLEHAMMHKQLEAQQMMQQAMQQLGGPQGPGQGQGPGPGPQGPPQPQGDQQ